MSLMSLAENLRFWIIAALILGLLVGDIGDAAPTVVMVALMAMMSISLIGLDVRKNDITERRRELVMAAVCCFVVSGGMTLAVGMFFDDVLWKGWVLLATVPCAISVVSGTLILKGDTKFSLIAITVIYIVALALTPLLTYLFLGDAVSPAEILKYVVLFILVPILISMPLKRVALPASVRNVMINVFFFILIFVAFGSNRDFIFDRPELIAAVIAACIVRLALVNVIMEFILKRMGMERGTRIVMVILSIWKNSALAMTLAMILIPEAEAAIPGALSLPLEMIWFMVMMWYYGKRCPPSQKESKAVGLNTGV